MASNVRVRFAPSPTGFLHLGGLRTALFNFLFARASNGSGGGQLILRIEDTDQERSVSGATDNLLEALHWLGISFDEGPNVGGAFGPYAQSQRLHLYQQYAKEMINRNGSYCCFCSKERLESLRERGASYDGHCRHLSERQVNEKLRQGLPHVMRLKVPREGGTIVNDMVYGRVPFPNDSIDDQVLLKSDGAPTYHLANVVDDHLMEISHVLRGEEWLSSTSKHILIYRSLGWPIPVFAHLPLLMSSTGGKLSKRRDSIYVNTYKERGFLPEAIVNFVALMGWNPKSEQEFFSLNELIQQFSIEGINKSSAVVDEKRLLWFNAHHYNQQCQDTEKMALFVNQLRNCLLSHENFRLSSNDCSTSTEYLKQVILLMQERTSLIPDIPYQAPYFWTDPDLSQCSPPQLTNTVSILNELITEIETCSEMTVESLSPIIKGLRSIDKSIPRGQVMALLRYALTGGLPGPSIVTIMSLLGKETVIRRLSQAIRRTIQ